MSTGPHQHFLDWLKASGMLLILIGHAVGSPHAMFNAVSAPVYSKQLGVAFFVFVAGWGLARTRRPSMQEAFNRVFGIYLYGVLCALALSVVFLTTKGDINESNYLPLFLGVNVFLNYFPANPTTWYIGMYLHLILLWALFRPQISSPWQIVAIALAEIIVRALILGLDRPFTAYMMVTNWLTVFALGAFLHKSEDRSTPAFGALLASIWLAVLTVWYLLLRPLELNNGFPTRLGSDDWIGLLAISAMVTVVYAVNTLFAFSIFRCWRSNVAVRFVARNTLLIFILHMPLYYLAAGKVYAFVDGPPWLEKSVLVVIAIVALGAFSEVINRLWPLPVMRDRTQALAARVFPRS